MPPTVCVFNQTRESFLCLSAVSMPGASTHLDFRGLAAEVPLGSGTLRKDGIWRKPSARGAYTVGASLPEDRVYLDGRNRVIQLIEHLSPLQMVPLRRPFASVLEVRIRTIHSSRTQVGDELLICSAEQMEIRWRQIREQAQQQEEGPETGTKQEDSPCSNG